MMTIPDGGYRIIYADPPWPWNARTNPDTRFGMGISDKYDSMKIRDIKNMGYGGLPACDGWDPELPPIQELAARDCLLWMWSTSHHQDRAIEVMKSWGFTFCGVGLIWIKVTKDSAIDEDGRGGNLRVRVLPGHYTGNAEEYVLIGRRGKAGYPKERLTSKVIFHPLMPSHSEKPPVFRDRIASLYDGPRIELFSRHTAASAAGDWDMWGNEVGKLSPKVVVHRKEQ